MRSITINSILGSLLHGQGTIIVRDGKRKSTLRCLYISIARNLSAKAAASLEASWLAVSRQLMSWHCLPLGLATQHLCCRPVVVAAVTVDGTVSTS